MLLITRRLTGFKAKALGGVPIQPGAFAMCLIMEIFTTPKLLYHSFALPLQLGR